MSAEVVFVQGYFGANRKSWRATSVVRCVDGLAITKCMEPGRVGWVITHIRSGHALGLTNGMVFPTQAAAEDALASLLLLADWHQSESEIGRQRHVAEIGDLLCESIAAEVCR